MFASLPELALPDGFSEEGARRWIERIREPSRRTMVRTRLEELLAGWLAP